MPRGRSTQEPTSRSPGTLTGSGALTKTGSGSLIVGPGVHTHNGGVAVNAGTLIVNGSLAGEGAVSINNGGGVAGSGTLVLSRQRPDHRGQRRALRAGKAGEPGPWPPTT